ARVEYARNRPSPNPVAAMRQAEAQVRGGSGRPGRRRLWRPVAVRPAAGLGTLGAVCSASVGLPARRPIQASTESFFPGLARALRDIAFDVARIGGRATSPVAGRGGDVLARSARTGRVASVGGAIARIV